MTDYYLILSRALASVDPKTAQVRTALFERARSMLLQQIDSDRQRWSDAAADAELAHFDAAVARIERELTARTTSEVIGRSRPADFRAAARPDDAAPKRSIGVVASVATVAAAVLLTAATVYLLRGGDSASPPGKNYEAKAPDAKKTALRPELEDGDLPPGVDGGSTEAGLPYYLRRQAVYYRSVYSVGMVVVDRSQRFLYLVQPQSRALRYGIGVGGECEIRAGLYRVQSMVRWPEWSPSPALQKRRSYPARMPGGPGNPLGAAVMYLENEVPGIHGTNAPRSIGQAPEIGCIRLINDDVVDLEKRVAIGTGVVVLN